MLLWLLLLVLSGLVVLPPRLWLDELDGWRVRNEFQASTMWRVCWRCMLEERIEGHTDLGANGGEDMLLMLQVLLLVLLLEAVGGGPYKRHDGASHGKHLQQQGQQEDHLVDPTTSLPPGEGQNCNHELTCWNEAKGRARDE